MVTRKKVMNQKKDAAEQHPSSIQQGPGQLDPEITAEEKCAATEKARQPESGRLGHNIVQVIEYRHIRDARCKKTGGPDLSPIHRKFVPL
jgi:hypothetical protein